jgi:hypothetical protein
MENDEKKMLKYATLMPYKSPFKSYGKNDGKFGKIGVCHSNAIQRSIQLPW